MRSAVVKKPLSSSLCRLHLIYQLIDQSINHDKAVHTKKRYKLIQKNETMQNEMQSLGQNVKAGTYDLFFFISLPLMVNKRFSMVVLSTKLHEKLHAYRRVKLSFSAHSRCSVVSPWHSISLSSSLLTPIWAGKVFQIQVRHATAANLY